jgi:hypothetical protein
MHAVIHLEPQYRPKHAPSYAYYRPRRDDYEVVRILKDTQQGS